MSRKQPLVLASGCLATHDLASRIAAAANASFTGIGIRNAAYEAAHQLGKSDADLRALLAFHGITVVDLQPLMHWGLCGPLERHARAVEKRAYRVAAALGGDHLIAPGQADDLPLDVLVERFAALCDRAAGWGLRVGLEFLPWTGIPDAGRAWRVVEAADRPNGGVIVDSWHFYRGSANEAVVKAIPRDRLIAVHLDDGDEPVGDPIDDTRRRRLLPGEGSFPLADFVGMFEEIGADAHYSVEVLSDAFEALPVEEAAHRAWCAAQSIIETARRRDEIRTHSLRRGRRQE